MIDLAAGDVNFAVRYHLNTVSYVELLLFILSLLYLREAITVSYNLVFPLPYYLQLNYVNSEVFSFLFFGISLCVANN
jgi:hypothetical protein